MSTVNVFGVQMQPVEFLAICALVVPFLTVVANNIHLLIMRKLELMEERRVDSYIHIRDAFENYLKSVGRCIELYDNSGISEYGYNYYTALMYAEMYRRKSDPRLRPLLEEINDLMLKNKYDEAAPKVNEASLMVSGLLYKLSKRCR